MFIHEKGTLFNVSFSNNGKKIVLGTYGELLGIWLLNRERAVV